MSYYDEKRGERELAARWGDTERGGRRERPGDREAKGAGGKEEVSTPARSRVQHQRDFNPLH